MKQSVHAYGARGDTVHVDVERSGRLTMQFDSSDNCWKITGADQDIYLHGIRMEVLSGEQGSIQPDLVVR
jgi:hypothetical protein